MAKRIYEKYDWSQVTDSMLQEASQLFSENYGVWGKNAGRVGRAFAKEGKLTQVDTIPSAYKNRKPCTDRAQFLPKDGACSYVRVTVDNHLAGNVFACRWTYNNKSVCWITQLVVHRDYRERRLAVAS